MRNNRTTNRPEFVYTEHYSAFGQRSFTSLHRIIKKTFSTLYVDSSNDYPGGWHGFGIRVVLTLNRMEMESQGRAWSRSQGRYYYALPAVSFHTNDKDEKSLPRFVETLELPIPFTVEDIKNAYRRKAKQAHPDSGGSMDDFIALQESYQQALSFFELP